MDIDEAKKLILNSEIRVPQDKDEFFDDENEEPARNKKLAHNPESSDTVFKFIDDIAGSIDVSKLILPI